MTGEILTAEQLAERWQVQALDVREVPPGELPKLPLPGKYSGSVST